MAFQGPVTPSLSRRGPALFSFSSIVTRDAERPPSCHKSRGVGRENCPRAFRCVRVFTDAQGLRRRRRSGVGCNDLNARAERGPWAPQAGALAYRRRETIVTRLQRSWSPLRQCFQLSGPQRAGRTAVPVNFPGPRARLHALHRLSAAGSGAPRRCMQADITPAIPVDRMRPRFAPSRFRNGPDVHAEAGGRSDAITLTLAKPRVQQREVCDSPASVPPFSRSAGQYARPSALQQSQAALRRPSRLRIRILPRR
jgi:hypothetical protein